MAMPGSCDTPSEGDPAVREPARPRRRMLSVFTGRDHRDMVRDGCLAHGTHWQYVEAAAPTDAVLTLLSCPVDVVLVDLDWPGDLLGALVRHVRRSSPLARLLAFGQPTAALRDKARQAGIGEAHPWGALAGLLQRCLDGQPRPAAPA